MKKILTIIILSAVLLYSVWLYRDANALVIMGAYYGSCTPSLMQALNTDATNTMNIGLDNNDDYQYGVTNFTASSSYQIWSITAGLKEVNTVEGNVYAKLFADDGPGDDPGTLLGTSSAVDAAGIGTAIADIEFTFTEGLRPSLTNGVVYQVGIYIDALHATDYLHLIYSSSGSLANHRGTAGQFWVGLDESSETRISLYGCAL